MKIPDLYYLSDASQMKANPYESATFQQAMEATWQGLKPLYEQVIYIFYVLHFMYLYAIV